MLEGLKAWLFLPLASLAALLSPDSAQPLVANQEVSSVRMRRHQLEARPGQLPWSPLSSAGRLCLSCVIIPSQLWAAGPGTPWPLVLSPAPASLLVTSHSVHWPQSPGRGPSAWCQSQGGDNTDTGHRGHQGGHGDQGAAWHTGGWSVVRGHLGRVSYEAWGRSCNQSPLIIPGHAHVGHHHLQRTLWG